MNFNLPKDMIYLLALNLDMSTLAAYCRVNKKLNNISCDNEQFWMAKLKKDFYIEYKKNRESAKHVYRTIYETLTEAFNSIYNNYPSIVQKHINREDLRKEFIRDSIENIIKPFYDNTDSIKYRHGVGSANMAIHNTWSEYVNNPYDFLGDDLWLHDFLIDVEPIEGRFEWSYQMIGLLKPNEFLDINTGEIVNLQNRDERPANEIWIPSLRVVGTEEDILTHFRKLHVDEHTLIQHIAAKLLPNGF